MKKIISIILVLAMILVLAACGSSKKSNSTPNLGSAGNSGKASRGTIIGDNYSNYFAELNFTKPSDWEYYTDEQIAQTMNVGVDMIKDEYQKLLETTGSLYDMMVMDPGTGTNVSVMFENLAVTGSTGMSADEYLNALKRNLSVMTDMGYSFGDVTSAELSGQNYRCLATYVSMNGIDMEQRYYVRVEGNYMIGVIVTLIATDAAEVEAMFS